METAATKDGIKTESLPPSEHAAYQHSCRVFLQVIDWKFLEEANCNPVSWEREEEGEGEREREREKRYFDFMLCMYTKCKSVKSILPRSVMISSKNCFVEVYIS